MSDWEEQINSILNDPAQMSRIGELAASLMGGGGESQAPPPSGPPPGLAEMLRSFSGAQPDDKRALLEAMKPWLSEKRRAKLERAVKLARMARLAELAMEEQGEREAREDV